MTPTSDAITPETLPDVLTIHVTAEDIARGVRLACAACPIALAATRATGRAADVSDTVGIRRRNDESGRLFTRYGLSPRARAFIVRFDTTGECSPATFRLRRLGA